MATSQKEDLLCRTTRGRRVAVAMSGGIDSLRAASILKDRGHDVFGLHMILTPSASQGLLEASIRLSRLAERLGIPISTVDLSQPFEEIVVQPFIHSYLAGLTPNPCVRCNPAVKFGLLMDEAFRMGADAFATGHYARVLPPDAGTGRYGLARGADPGKDQSYFLYGLSQEQLSRIEFPLGESRKRDVRSWAEASDFGRDIPEESQEICFIPAGGYRAFMEARLGGGSEPREGPILDMTGKELGRHKGIHAYTVGQRRGLGLPSSAPYYVVRIEPRHNAIRVGRQSDLLRSGFIVSGINWSSMPAPTEPFTCLVRIRNQHLPAPATVERVAADEALVRLDTPQRAVTPGQAAVFYRDNLVLGGGTILTADNERIS